MCPDLKGEVRRITHVFSTNFAVSSEFTLGDSKFMPLIFDCFLSMNN